MMLPPAPFVFRRRAFRSPSVAPARQRGGSLLPVILALLIVVVLVGAWWFLRVPAPEPRVEQLPPPEPVAVEEPEPEPETDTVPADPDPVADFEPAPEPEPTPEPLPSLDQSDPVVLEAVQEVEAAESAVELSVQDDILRKWVRAAIAADDGNLVDEYRPLNSPPGKFLVEPIDEEYDPDIGRRYRLSPDNYSRYDKYVSALENIDKEQLGALYRRFYPLLQAAYEQHGVDRGGMHTVVLSVIDSLLAAPVIEEEIILVQPKVYYHYFDPELEALPEPQKLLIRTGPENTRRIQAALRELREELVKHRP